MQKNLMLEEVQALFLKVLEYSEITLQQRAGSSPSFSMNLTVTKATPIHNGIQFHVNGGYINFELPELTFFKDGNPYEEGYTFEFKPEYDKPKGHWLHLGSTTLFFYGDKVLEVLRDIKEVTNNFVLEKETEYRLREEADRYVPKEAWIAIEDRMEK